MREKKTGRGRALRIGSFDVVLDMTCGEAAGGRPPHPNPLPRWGEGTKSAQAAR